MLRFGDFDAAPAYPPSRDHSEQVPLGELLAKLPCGHAGGRISERGVFKGNNELNAFHMFPLETCIVGDEEVNA